MSHGKVLLAGICAALIVGCSHTIPYEMPADLARIEDDLRLQRLPSEMLPLKWSYFEYGVQQKGLDTVDTLALVQPGLLTLVGYEKGHYVRQAEFTSATTDCMYIFNGNISAQPVWLLRNDKVIFLTTGNERGLIDIPRRKRLIDEMMAAGFAIHSETQGKAYSPTGVIESKLVMMSGYGKRFEEMEQHQVYNVCKKQN